MTTKNKHELSSLSAAVYNCTAYKYYPGALSRNFVEPGSISKKRYNQAWHRIWRASGIG